MCCLTCAYFDPIEPEFHKKQREAGQCQSACGKKWHWHTAFRYVMEHDQNRPLQGACRLNPQPMAKASWDFCGQHEPVLDESNGWGIRKFNPQSGERSLKEWANRQYWNIRKGGDEGNHFNKRTRELEESNAELRRQLATARKRSAARLAKLQKNTTKKPKKTKLPPWAAYISKTEAWIAETDAVAAINRWNNELLTRIDLEVPANEQARLQIIIDQKIAEIIPPVAAAPSRQLPPPTQAWGELFAEVEKTLRQPPAMPILPLRLVS